MEMFQLGRLDVFLHALDFTSYSEETKKAVASPEPQSTFSLSLFSSYFQLHINKYIID